jgi:hypothetical protein
MNTKESKEIVQFVLNEISKKNHILDPKTSEVAAERTNIIFGFDGGTSAIAADKKYSQPIDFDCKLLGWKITALGASGVIKFDVWKTTYELSPPTNTNSITNGHEPEILTTGLKAQSITVSGWAPTIIRAGDVLVTNVDSCTSITNATLSLKVRRI